jgi:hypothetical protein
MQRLLRYRYSAGEKNWNSSTVNNRGTISKNLISGALQSINIDKSGRTNSPTKIFGNVFRDSRIVTVQKSGRTITTSNLNEAPESVVYYDLGQKADTRQSLAPETNPIDYLLSCNNYPSLCRNQEPQNTTFFGNVFCQATDGKVYPLPNVEVRVFGSGNNKELLARTNDQGNFTTSFKMPYQSYQISANCRVKIVCL